MASPSHRSALLAVVVLALLALPAAAAAQSGSSALAQERYYSSYGRSATPVSAQTAALAQERYYSSYGNPTAIRTVEPVPSDGPGWTIAVLGGIALLLAGVAFGAAGSRAVVRQRVASA
jgi:hypothetical protein